MKAPALPPFPARWSTLVLGLAVFGGHAFAQTQEALSSPSVLKKLSVEELMDVEVTSVSLYPEKLLEAPSAIQVVTSDDIHRSGASSIPEALRLADNLEVAQKGSHDWGITARGFNTDLANKLLVLIDGRSVYTPLFSGVFWDVQDYLLEDIDRIEVISGPGGTLWGANAVNGVINITTKSAKDTQGLYTEAGGGTELRDFASVRYGATLAPNVYFRVYGKYFDRDSAVLANGSDAEDSWNMAQGGFRLDAEASPQNNLTLQGDVYSGNEDIPTGGGEKVGGGNILGRWSHTFSDDSDTSLQLYYDRTHLASPKPKGNFVPAGILTDDLDTYDLNFQHRFRLNERNRIVWGFGYRFTHDVVGPAPSVTFVPTKLGQDLFSGFAQDEIKLLDNLFFTFGSKVEHNDYTGREVEPNARLRFNLTPRQMLWAAVSRAVRTPSRIDRDLREPTGLPPPFPQSVLNGGANFASETVIAYEVGYRAQLGSKTTTSISTFYNDYDHVRSTTPGRPGFPSLGFPLVFQNNLEGKTYGAEVSASYQLFDWWRLRGSYDLLREHLSVKPGQVDFSNALNETADPEQQWSVRSSMDLPQNLSLDAGLRWVDVLHINNGPNVGTVPSYFELDVRLGWNVTKRLELSVVGQNLLHDHHPEYGFPGPTQEEIQRSVYGKAVWRY
ncbi:MAG TPA: TonB-dependent receptor [Opitutaceae bacterium]|jgi:iron complex outermembrane receptor protein|nr:TonB-dependent receptor [Opitutaceae bacterium]